MDADVVEGWDMEKIREYVSMLTEMNRPKNSTLPGDQSPKEVENDLRSMFGKPEK
jgi:hypothetical protein